LSNQNVEICLQKYLPISGRLLIAIYLKQNAVESKSFGQKNNLKVEKLYIISKTSTTSLPQKSAWGMRRDKHAKKLESNYYAGTLPWKVFIASQGH